jgi:transposase
MQQVHYALGLDVDKATFKACLKVKEPSNKSTIRGTKPFPNSTQGFKDLESWIKKHKKFDEAELKIIMEATGVYHEHLAWYLHQGNFQVYIMLPLRAKRYLQSLGVKSKNDKIDAQGLADMGLQQELNQWKPCSKNILVLRSLTRQLQICKKVELPFATSWNQQLI